MSYSPPASAKPFNLAISDDDLSDFHQLLKLSKLGPTTYENTQTKENFGVTEKWLSGAKDHWLNTYDWRAQESSINSFPNYKMQLENIDVHFIALFSQKPDAIPMIFMHGWPGSFIEFLPMLDIIRKEYPDGKNMPYHIIVPSLPGYTLSSSAPVDKDWTMADSARVMNSLMVELGFEKYVAQGGDVGSFVARLMAKEYEGCVGCHCTFSQRDGWECIWADEHSESNDHTHQRAARPSHAFRAREARTRVCGAVGEVGDGVCAGARYEAQYNWVCAEFESIGAVGVVSSPPSCVF
jgi:microsomal epoxide hydrolase